MDAEELLHIQDALIRTLSTAGASHPALRGIDASRLDLVARLTHAKRIDKIRSLLPATFATLGARADSLALEFAARHPPLDAHGVLNAMQFLRFLSRVKDCPAYLPDLCFCELAMVYLGARPAPEPCLVSYPVRSVVEMRRRPSVRLRRCEYDIRPLLQSRRDEVEKRIVYLVVCRPPGSSSGKVFEIEEGLFVLLSLLRRWHSLQPDDEWLTEEKTFRSISELCALGILELSPSQ